jgi:hypothetical protein
MRGSMKLVSPRASILFLAAAVAAPLAAAADSVNPAAVFFPGDSNTFTGTNFARSARYTQQGMYFDSGLSVAFVGANPQVELVGLDPTGAAIHFLQGAQRETRNGYAGILYRNLYKGIDLSCRFSGNGWKSDFILAPGAPVSSIRLRYTGIGTVKQGPQGELLMTTAFGEMEERIPAVYQTKPDGTMLFRTGRYVILADGLVGFEVPELDPALPTVVDPDLLYSTYWGGSRNEAITAVASGTDDAIFIAGWTESINLITAAPVQATNRGSTDGFVAKLSSSGQTLLWATFIGGSGADRINAMALDSSNRAVIAGSTYSNNFPTVTPIQSATRGLYDGFVARLSVSGAALEFSTYFGGTGSDLVNAVAVDTSGIYVGGQTTSADFPVANALYVTSRGGQDGFIAKLNANGTGTVFSTYYGGSYDDAINAIAVRQNEVFAAGGTMSSNLPVVGGAGPRGGMDGFVVHLNSAGSAVSSSTYVGGSGGSAISPETVTAVKVTTNGEAVVGGVTPSSDFPTSGGAQVTFGRGGSDGFVAKYNAAMNALMWGTYLGGNSYDAVSAVGIRASGQVVVTGSTSSFNFPANQPLQAVHGGYYDAFLTIYNSGGTLSFSSLWGGSGSDSAAALAIGTLNANAVLVGGSTNSTNLAIAGGGLQNTADIQSLNGFLARFQIAGGTGKGRDKVGIFRRAGWALDKTGDYIWNAGDVAFSMGATNDIPVIGDWDGTGKYRIGVYRDGTWYLDMNGDYAWTWGVDSYFYFGIAGDKPVVGDWTGTGKSKLGVYRNGVWYLDWDGNGAWTQTDHIVQWGTSTDVPVTGDWTGTGVTRIGLFKDGLWKLDLNGDYVFAPGVDSEFSFGMPGDIPIPCDLFGVGTTQVVVWRPASGAWITSLGPVGYFGYPGDVPIAAPWQ